jgi:hypothetical protein
MLMLDVHIRQEAEFVAPPSRAPAPVDLLVKTKEQWIQQPDFSQSLTAHEECGTVYVGMLRD